MPLTDDQLLQLIDAGESDRVERKRNAENTERICEGICGLANDLPNSGQAGVIFVGLEDNGDCGNLSVDDKLLLRLASLRDRLSPFPSLTVRRIVAKGCEIATIVVEPSDQTPIHTAKSVTIAESVPKKHSMIIHSV